MKQKFLFCINVLATLSTCYIIRLPIKNEREEPKDTYGISKTNVARTSYEVARGLKGFRR